MKINNDYENLREELKGLKMRKDNFSSIQDMNIAINEFIEFYRMNGIELSVDDFKDVIFTCYKKFVKNDFDGKNGKSSIQYYNPETIFTSSKMEKYINEYDRVLNY